MTRFGKIALVAAMWIVVLPRLALAHGGIAGPDELGPPVITSALLGIGCYWAVILWPSRRKQTHSGKQKPIRRAGMR
jgi:hypothetical protein